MPIKEVSEIPKQKKREAKGHYCDYKGAIRKDIEEAFDKKISKFEIIGYTDTTPEYVANVAKNVAHGVSSDKVYTPASEKLRKSLEGKYPSKYIVIKTPSEFDENKIIKIRTVTLSDDAKHVFVEIDYKYAKNFPLQLGKDVVADIIRRMDLEAEYVPF